MFTKRFFFTRRVLAGAVFSAAVALNGSAMASPKLFAYKGAANSITINGTFDVASNSSVNNGVDPFTVELYSSGNECLIFKLNALSYTSNYNYPNMDLAGPDRTWSNLYEDKIVANTAKRGWYILRMSPDKIVQSATDFTATISRLDSIDPVCRFYESKYSRYY